MASRPSNVKHLGSGGDLLKVFSFRESRDGHHILPVARTCHENISVGDFGMWSQQANTNDLGEPVLGCSDAGPKVFVSFTGKRVRDTLGRHLWRIVCGEQAANKTPLASEEVCR